MGDKASSNPYQNGFFKPYLRKGGKAQVSKAYMQVPRLQTREILNPIPIN